MLIESKTTFDLTNSCSFVFQDLKLKANYTISANGSLDNQKYGCASCLNSTTNMTFSCDPCYLEVNGIYPVLPLEEYVIVTQTDLDYTTDRILLDNKLESFKLSQHNLTVIFENETVLNNTIINFKKNDKACIYSTIIKFISCSSLNGTICTSIQECLGNFLKVDDTTRCCDKICRDLTEQPKPNESINITQNATSKFTETQQLESAEILKEELNIPDIEQPKITFFNKKLLLIFILAFILIIALIIFFIFLLKKRERPPDPSNLW